ncbi:N-lysine methyltransferase KMT5A-A-like isoform X1 [Montipora foliosa]|uniref:N-lysine methyltransferase KMT5A-A-like isoform X1 n=1 Tax=Montipora foliosa TaxID=591990 RepID=UPI0035F18C99
MKKQTRSYRRGNGGRPEDVALAYINSNSDQPGLEERYISEYIGKGVFATREFKSGHFLLQYKGELVSAEEGERREKQYSLDFGNFLYFFQWNEATYCIDATFSHGLGRLVNDLPAKKANCKMKKVIVSGKVCLCLFATKDIAPNEELRYDYGLKDLPWRVKSGDGSDNMNKNWKNSTTRKDGAVISQDCEEVVCAKEDSCKDDLSDNIDENRKNCTTG